MAYYAAPPIPTSTILAPNLGQQFSPSAQNNYPGNDNNADGYPYPVWVYGTPVLLQPAQAVPITNGQLVWRPTVTLQNLVQVLAYTLGNHQGTGISANQVGLLWQVFIVDSTQFPTTGLQVTNTNNDTVTLQSFDYPSDCANHGTYYVFINPVMKPTSAAIWFSTEECLSIPDVPSPLTTTRYQSFTLSFQTLTGSSLASSSLYEGLVTYTSQYTAGEANAPNWVLQHETDHLNGILYTQKSGGITATVNTYLTTVLATGGENGVYQQAPQFPHHF